MIEGWFDVVHRLRVVIPTQQRIGESNEAPGAFGENVTSRHRRHCKALHQQSQCAADVGSTFSTGKLLGADVVSSPSPLFSYAGRLHWGVRDVLSTTLPHASCSYRSRHGVPDTLAANMA